jgi:hypothetical protein
MDTPSSSQLTTDKTVSIVLLALGALGTLIWALPSIMLVMMSDAGMRGAAWLLILFLLVAWFGPAAATVTAAVWGSRRLKRGATGTWWRVLLVLLSAPVLIVILGSIFSALPL